MKRFLLLSLVIGLVSGVIAQTATDTLWTDDFSDGNYSTNWEWTVSVGSGNVVNQEFVLSGALPYFDTWAWTLGDTSRTNYGIGSKYGLYYSVRLDESGTGTPASTVNIKDDGTIYWIVDLYPSSGGIYLLRGEYPAAANYIAWVTNLPKIQLGQKLKVLAQVMEDTFRVKVWTGPFEPTSWDLEHTQADTMGTLWPGIQVGGWYMNTATVTYDDFMFVLYEPVTLISESKSNSIEDFRLFQNYPNPFNPTTTIDFNLPSSQEVKLIIYDLSGRGVRTLLEEKRGAGLHSVVWNGLDDAGKILPSGVYFYQLTAGSYSNTRKLMLIK